MGAIWNLRGFTHHAWSVETDTVACLHKQTHKHIYTHKHSCIFKHPYHKHLQRHFALHKHPTNNKYTESQLVHTHTHTHHIPHKDWHKNTYINEILASIFSVVWACSRTYDLYKAFILKGALQPWPVLISSSGTFSMQILAGPIRTLQSLHRYPGQRSTKLPRKSFLPIASSKPHFDSSQSPH